MKLQKYAQSIVVGKMAKDRCDENVHILEGIISKLPPLEVMASHRAIEASLVAFAIKPDLISCSIQLIKDCAPHIANIKEKLGSTHQYYLKISTTIINNALGNIIAEVNKAQNSDFNTHEVYVNGELLEETYIKEPTALYYDVEFPYVVPEGCVFVMGDNRNDSLDSRSSRIGPIDERYILGKAVFRILPVNEFRFFGF